MKTNDYKYYELKIIQIIFKQVIISEVNNQSNNNN